MNFYLTIASAYFQTFEGRHLLPSWRSWHWYAWVGTLILFIWCFGHWIIFNPQKTLNKTQGLAFAVELLFLAVTAMIGMFKRAKLLASLPAGEAPPNQRIDQWQRHTLEELLGCQPTQFLQIAKEIEDLCQLQRKYKTGPQRQAVDFGRLIYDPDSKARLLSITLAAIALFVTLLTRTSEAPLPNVLEIIADNGVWTIVSIAVTFSILLFGLMLGLRMVAREFLEVLKTSVASVLRRQQGGRTELTYLVRHLIKHHERSRSLS